MPELDPGTLSQTLLRVVPNPGRGIGTPVGSGRALTILDPRSWQRERIGKWIDLADNFKTTRWTTHMLSVEPSGQRRVPQIVTPERILWVEVKRNVRVTRREELDRVIESSKRILELGDDWDNAGSAGYLPETWQRMVAFLRLLDRVARFQGTELPIPAIGPAEYGSIDMHWSESWGSLLVNISADPDAPIAFYGSSRQGSTLSGTVPIGSVSPEVIAWLSHDRYESLADRTNT